MSPSNRTCSPPLKRTAHRTVSSPVIPRRSRSPTLRLAPAGRTTSSATTTFGRPTATDWSKFRGIHHSVSRHLGDRVMHIERLWPVLEAGHVGYKGGRREGAKGFYLSQGRPEVDARVYGLLGREVGAGPTPFEISVRPVWQM